ncbi:sigma factor-like helix-turn-helix DNA-binding protein [Flavobacterium granuli]|uniref:Sigma-70, region 4 n=1 Tax=Flavobacterium granuli TaxID=280093 RepID=A0A1M5S9P7_9FLAO|nr:sigma factor-like helix-turn-helix DNA-binding protein [Flavobacterium granuli]PRZ21259.1 sigma-70-like protein [Flavobacterium granuli]SHH35226.1 Sigma-70, region 4 [Flavobacterium granuli]
MTIDEIHKNEPLSVRSYHVCKYNRLETLSDIIKFYRENRSFDKLRNCGKKSNEELTELYNKYKDIDFVFQEIFPVKFENKFKIIISELSRNQREVINSFIQVNTNSLSVRSQNGIKALLENNLKIKNYADKILFEDGFDIKKIKNIGAGTVPELEVFVNIVEDFIIEVSKNENDKYLISLKNKFLIQNTFSLSNIPNEILESESIFQLTSFLINQNAFYDKNQTKILTKAFKIYLNSPELTLDEIAKEVDLTRERVRQLRKIIFEELSSKLLFIQNFDDNLLEKYNIDNTQCYIEINDSQIEVINNQNNTNFTKEFIIYLIYSYWSYEFELVGNNEDVLLPKYFNARNRHNWNDFYLVKKELVQEFDFISLANDISERLNERLEETYSFSFKSYLSNFLINDNLEILNSIMEIAEKIVNQEFGIYIDLEDNIIFERNSIKTLPEYIFEALDEIGKPSTVEVLYEFIENRYPGISKSSEALRGSCQRSDTLIYFGRSSTYGLKKWEIEMENIKGGTIKNIITELLNISDTPIHINEILNEVHKYRELTNERNIITNLKLDPSKDFIIYNQKFVGLKAKIKIYENDKYENLPIQLGKKIIGLINRGVFQSKTALAKYLEEKYLLTENETNNILLNLKITI